MCGQAGVLFCGEEDQHYLYLVCVVTGWWKAAGTTANVFFSINGESISSDTNHVGIQSCVFSSSIFSSPEHEVLMVSYCGQWLSVVRRRVSCVVRRPSTFDVYTL